VDDLAEEADVKQILRPTPLIVDEACHSSRASQQRAFQVLSFVVIGGQM